MVEERRALRAWEVHLEEVIGVEEATAIVDRYERNVTPEYLDQALDRALEEQTHRLTAAWRRDLLLVTGAQFFALAAAVAALVALG